MDSPEQVEKSKSYRSRDDIKRRHADAQRKRYHEDESYAEDKRRRSREYSKSERGAETRRAFRKEYLQRPGVRARVRSQQRAYECDPKNKVKIKTHKQQYRQTENGKQINQRYYRKKASTPEGKAKLLAHKLKRITLAASLPNSFTGDQWLQAVDYFGGCCAVCGRPLNDLFGEHRAGADHWIPLTDPRPDNPGTVATNVVPLCHGVRGCNNSKGNKNPIDWLIEKFGKRKARTILKRIEAYFEWVRQQRD